MTTAPENELLKPPAFEIGQKIKTRHAVRNDGTFPGKPTGEVLVEAGEPGYVIKIGTYLQLHYIYGVDFYERGIVVGMRAKELDLLDGTYNRPQDARP